jgi:hypothetical protein
MGMVTRRSKSLREKRREWGREGGKECLAAEEWKVQEGRREKTEGGVPTVLFTLKTRRRVRQFIPAIMREVKTKIFLQLACMKQSRYMDAPQAPQGGGREGRRNEWDQSRTTVDPPLPRSFTQMPSMLPSKPICPVTVTLILILIIILTLPRMLPSKPISPMFHSVKCRPSMRKTVQTLLGTQKTWKICIAGEREGGRQVGR